MKQNWMQEHGHQQPQGWCKGEHKTNRAIIISNPDVVLECMPGCVVLHDIEVMNKTNWGWKQGVFLGMDSSIEQSGLPIEVVNVPVDQKVEGNNGTLKMSVPITVLDSAKPSDKVYEYKLRFCGPKGGQFGEPIPIKVKVIGAATFKPVAPQEEPVKKSHVELVQVAVKLFDSEKLGQTFNEVLEVVTLVNGDIDLAKKSLQPRQ